MVQLNRRSFLAAALAGVATSALGACGGSSKDDAAAPEAKAEVPTSGTLKVWCWDPAFNLYAMKEAGKVYAKKYPDVKLDVIEMPWDDVQTKLTTLAQSNKGEELPDIFLCQNNAFQKNVINYGDLFADLTKSGVNYAEFPEAVVNYSKVDGANYGVPFDNGTAIQALRLDLIEKAGFKLEDFTDITWSDFITKGKTVKEKTGKPMISGTSNSVDLLMMMLQSAGASLFGDDDKPFIVGNDALIKSIDTYSQLVKSGVLVERNSWDQYIGTFINGNVVGTINGVWILGSVQTAKDQKGKWDITNVPKLEGVDGATNYTANGGSSWGVSAKGQSALAANFLKETFAGSTEFYDTILPASGAVANWIPAGKSEVYNKPQEFFDGSPIWAKVVEYAGKVPSNKTGVYYYEARDAVTVALTKIMKGGDVTGALQEAQKTVEFAMQ